MKVRQTKKKKKRTVVGKKGNRNLIAKETGDNGKTLGGKSQTAEEGVTVAKHSGLQQ